MDYMKFCVFERHFRTTRLFCLLLVLCLYLGVSAQERHDGIVYRSKLKSCDLENESIATTGGISFYQRFISSARGNRCAMFPSCSNYGLMAFTKRPFLEAMILTADRMIRCGHDGRYYDLTYEYGYPSLVDYLPFDTVPRSILYKPKSFIMTNNIICQNSNDSVVGFIHNLINKHNYEIALLEIERIAYFNPTQFNSSMYLQKLLCYDGLNREEEGVFDYDISGKNNFGKDSKVQLQIAKMYYEMRNYKEAINILKDASKTNGNLAYKSELFKSLSSLRMGYEVNAYNQMVAACNLINDNTLVRKNLQVFENISRKKKKNPFVAGILAIISGCGYIYDKQPGNAITSLLINSLLAYATYTSVKSKNYGIAGVTGLFSLTFYVGNILGSVNGAKRYNSKRISENAEMLERINHIY